jgi:hypothetical protein
MVAESPAHARLLHPQVVLPFAVRIPSRLEQPMSERQRAGGTTRRQGRTASRRSEVIVQIKIKLLDVSKPPVWRRLALRADTRLDQLHDTIVAAFGWHGSHMHVFTNGPE